ncbi:hypothetical protein [Caldicellulosiruptor naganoensis]|uniref:Uncharacterized protein n=1 Tax=Caldicellulosiruptor naganoensis TaxID=29324 RepID=A0ABY7BNN7_9FIRM|nr:hypothetical protein [Caldicellulosiruptor naganoensis]WAM32641.1 hypothetical protein OTJ99_000071 [Caldicellulosiruptor naganoensis]
MFEEELNSLQEAFLRGKLIDKAKYIFYINVDIVNLQNVSLLMQYQIISQGIILKDSENRVEFEVKVLREYLDFSYYSNIYNQR